MTNRLLQASILTLASYLIMILSQPTASLGQPSISQLSLRIGDYLASVIDRSPLN